eukprot:TRINITY_DN13135_c0_g1_i1.p1 TRINITY_DN13135_c0_g1~~TRINITY_DN13135_c0_g1_i1.p1  ORF type:complete len:227 (-),score=64.54 TRINITY_DN13135_c0_g1_i1:53-703(-)
METDNSTPTPIQRNTNPFGKRPFILTDHFWEQVAQWRIKAVGTNPFDTIPKYPEEKAEVRMYLDMQKEREKRWKQYVSERSAEIEAAKLENKKLRSLARDFNREYIKEHGPRPPKDAGPPTATVYWRPEVRVQIAKTELDRCMIREGPNMYENCKPLMDLFHDTIAFEQYCGQNNLSILKRWNTVIPVTSKSPVAIKFDNWMNAYWEKFNEYAKNK